VKIATIIVRIFVGFAFVAFGANAFFNFMPAPHQPTNAGTPWVTAMVETRYFWVVGAAQVLGGLPLLINRYVPLGLAILGPVIVNILSYHLLMNHEGISGAFIAAALWLFLFYAYREYFSSLFVQRAQPR
jgi:putative oxidoreductase